MEFENFIFQAWKVMEFKLLQVLEIHGIIKFCLVVWLLQMTKQGQCKIERS